MPVRQLMRGNKNPTQGGIREERDSEWTGNKRHLSDERQRQEGRQTWVPTNQRSQKQVR